MEIRQLSRMNLKRILQSSLGSDVHVDAAIAYPLTMNNVPAVLIFSNAESNEMVAETVSTRKTDFIIQVFQKGSQDTLDELISKVETTIRDNRTLEESVHFAWLTNITYSINSDGEIPIYQADLNLIAEYTGAN
ncbi:hypothetical protein JK628_02995 [Shewanella sp. KX20019]|uniref:hypothetical protein n=1 Tax=Shewanella sp. KX20019 TaxID=2803864 RepID=UPI001925EF8F|nr:hypothetical protein [Shewanella sp. KX20019]QQX80857.1 hypothetical protein JK628_02995 [Shewanella sp. KX20019]